MKDCRFKLALGLVALVIMTGMMPTPIQGQNFPPRYSVSAIQLSPDGTTIAKGNVDGELILYDALTANIDQVLQSSGIAVQDLAWSPDGTRIATIGFRGLVMMWDITLGSPLFSVNVADTSDFATSVGQLRKVSWSPNGQQIAVSGQDAGTAVLDASTGSRVYLLTSGETYSNVWFPYPNLITSSLSGLKIWSNGELIAAIPDIVTTDIAMSADLSSLAVLVTKFDLVAGNLEFTNEIQIINPTTLTVNRVVTIPDTQGSPFRIAWSLEDTYLAVSSFDGYLRVWESKTLTIVDEINIENEYGSFAWASDSEIIYGSGDDLVIEAIATPTP